MDRIIPKPGNKIRKDIVYKAFIDYCVSHKLTTCSSRAFGLALPDKIIDMLALTTEYVIEGNTRIPYWRDIDISDKDLTEVESNERKATQNELRSQSILQVPSTNPEKDSKKNKSENLEGRKVRKEVVQCAGENEVQSNFGAFSLKAQNAEDEQSQ
jgi:hypothetical protein